MRILVVEDEAGILAVVSSKLRQVGYEVDACEDGAEGLFAARSGVYDLILLDIMLPNVDGLTVLRKLREEGVASKIIMLTALSTVEDKLAGLEGGADDYLPKPFHMDELVARVRVQLRSGYAEEGRMVEFADLALDLGTSMLMCKGEELQLGRKELQLLELFLRHPGQVFAKDYIYGKVWGVDNEVESNSLEAYVSFLRKKLQVLGSRVRIVALRGLGYKVTEERNDES